MEIHYSRSLAPGEPFSLRPPNNRSESEVMSHFHIKITNDYNYLASKGTDQRAGEGNLAFLSTSEARHHSEVHSCSPCWMDTDCENCLDPGVQDQPGKYGENAIHCYLLAGRVMFRESADGKFLWFLFNWGNPASWNIGSNTRSTDCRAFKVFLQILA